jgi:nucleoside 2-deoxyribosyltransferase
MKIYLAARYSRRDELCKYRAILESKGHQVTSRWLQGGHEITKEGSTQAAQEARTRFAQEDWDDLMQADCCVSFTEEPRKTTTRGGRHVEYGAALAKGMRCIVVGFRENVFHCLPEVEFCEKFEDVSLLNLPN